MVPVLTDEVDRPSWRHHGAEVEAGAQNVVEALGVAGLLDQVQTDLCQLVRGVVVGNPWCLVTVMPLGRTHA